MDISIKIGNDYLDLAPGTTLDLEEENPFLQLGAEVMGQYSLPFTVTCTEKNMRLLGHPNMLQIRKRATGIDATLLINGIQHSRGQIKIETSDNNVNNPQKGTISLYYLFGVADFFKLIENKYLTDMNYGPDYVKPQPSLADPNMEDPSQFMGYITDVMRNSTPDTHEFAIFPMRNEAGSLELNVPTKNRVDIDTGNLKPVMQQTGIFSAVLDLNEILPFPYLHWVLKIVFKNIGWQLKGEMLADPEFKRIVLLHSEKISKVGRNVVSWNMRDHVPRVKISTFLIGLSNRLGWWFDFDYKKKVCEIRYRKAIMQQRTKKDITDKVAANYKGKFTTNKSYALLQSGGYAKPNLNQFDYKGEVNNFDNLPTATTALVDHLYFVRGENAYYYLEIENNVAKWVRSTDNTWDYIPDDKTDDIPVNCLVPDMTELMQLKNSGGATINRWITMPLVNILPGNEETDTFYICYYFGHRDAVNRSGSINHKFPMASAGCHDLHGNKIVSKSLTFEYPGALGMYDQNWKYYLNLLRQREEITIPINFELLDLMNFDYKQTVVIRNTEYFIKNPHFSLPLRDFTQVELARL